MQGIPLSLSVRKPTARAPRPHDVVILREDQVDDLGQAIQQVRADPATAGSQILIIAPEHEGASADEPLGSGELGPRVRAAAAKSAVQRVAGELEPLVGDLENLLGEAEREITGLLEAASEGTRAQMQHRARVLGEIGGWIRAVAGDLAGVARAAGEGRWTCDAVALWEEARGDLAGALGVRFVCEPVAGPVRIAADPLAVLDLLSACARLLDARLGRAGTVRVAVQRAARDVEVVFHGFGPSVPVRARELVERARVHAAAAGATLQPGPGGAEGASLTVVLPGAAD